MKKIIVFLVFLIVCQNSSLVAQQLLLPYRQYQEVLIQDQPITFNPNMLAHSQGLPNNFLLFAPDTSVQILFNPARAAFSGQKFVYANYLPQSPLTTLQASSLSNGNYYYHWIVFPIIMVAKVLLYLAQFFLATVIPNGSCRFQI